MYGTGPLGAQIFCNGATERPISYYNALLSFCSSINLSSREKLSVHLGELGEKIIFFGGGGELPPTGYWCIPRNHWPCICVCVLAWWWGDVAWNPTYCS